MEKSATGATPIQHSASKQLAQAVKDAGFTDFGFLVIRTGYGDDSLWEQWAEEFSNVIEKSVTGSEGADELIDKLMLAMIDDEELRNASWDGVQGYAYSNFSLNDKQETLRFGSHEKNLLTLTDSSTKPARTTWCLQA